jgi:hypothetical protein
MDSMPTNFNRREPSNAGDKVLQRYRHIMTAGGTKRPPRPMAQTYY